LRRIPRRCDASTRLDGIVDEILRLWPDSSRDVAEGLALDDPAPVEIVVLTSDTWKRWARGLLPEWGVGFANWPGGPIAIDAGRAVRDPVRFPRILKHEISHVYLGQRLNGHRPPTWFIEGVAQVQAGEWNFDDTIGLVQVASVSALPPLSLLHARFPTGGRAAERGRTLLPGEPPGRRRNRSDRAGQRRLASHARWSGGRTELRVRVGTGDGSSAERI
jgi:hypothetical protein